MFYITISDEGKYYYLFAQSLEEAKERVLAASKEYGYEFKEDDVYLLEHFSVIEDFNKEYLDVVGEN